MADKFYAKVSTSSDIGKIMGMAWQIIEKYGKPSPDREYVDAMKGTVENFMRYFEKSEYEAVVKWLGMALAEYLMIAWLKGRGEL